MKLLDEIAFSTSMIIYCEIVHFLYLTVNLSPLSKAEKDLSKWHCIQNIVRKSNIELFSTTNNFRTLKKRNGNIKCNLSLETRFNALERVSVVMWSKFSGLIRFKWSFHMCYWKVKTVHASMLEIKTLKIMIMQLAYVIMKLYPIYYHLIHKQGMQLYICRPVWKILDLNSSF